MATVIRNRLPAAEPSPDIGADAEFVEAAPREDMQGNQAGSPNVKGYTKFPNVLLEAIIRARLSGCELSVVLALTRYSLGFHRSSAAASLGFLSKAANRSRRQVWRALLSLEERGLIKKITEPTFRKPAAYAVSEEWTKMSTVDTQDTCGHERHLRVDKNVHTPVDKNVHPGWTKMSTKKESNIKKAKNKTEKTPFKPPVSGGLEKELSASRALEDSTDPSKVVITASQLFDIWEKQRGPLPRVRTPNERNVKSLLDGYVNKSKAPIQRWSALIARMRQCDSEHFAKFSPAFLAKKNLEHINEIVRGLYDQPFNGNKSIGANDRDKERSCPRREEMYPAGEVKAEPRNQSGDFLEEYAEGFYKSEGR